METKKKSIYYQDNRRTDRLGLSLNVFYALSPDLKWVGPVTLNNISGGGLQFTNNAPIKKTTALNLKIDLGNGYRPIVFEGEAVWCKTSAQKNTYRIGVKFHQMPLKDRQRYVRYICENILRKSLTEKGEIRPE